MREKQLLQKVISVWAQKKTPAPHEGTALALGAQTSIRSSIGSQSDPTAGMKDLTTAESRLMGKLSEVVLDAKTALGEGPKPITEDVHTRQQQIFQLRKTVRSTIGMLEEMRGFTDQRLRDLTCLPG